MTNGTQNRSQFVIGSHNGLTDRIATVRKRGGRERPGLTTFVVENTGAAPFTVSAFQSSDNGGGDAWAALNVRYNGGTVASVTVVPGGRAEFVAETFPEQYVEFRLGDGEQATAAGVLTLNTTSGEWTEAGQTGVAYPNY